MKLKNITSLDELEVGGYVYKNGAKKVVLEKLQNTVLISKAGCYDEIDAWCAIGDLKNNDIQIKDVEWTPKEGENYYYPSIGGCITVGESPYLCYPIDKERFKYGLVFKKRKEALKRREEILKMLEQ